MTPFKPIAGKTFPAIDPFSLLRGVAANVVNKVRLRPLARFSVARTLGIVITALIAIRSETARRLDGRKVVLARLKSSAAIKADDLAANGMRRTESEPLGFAGLFVFDLDVGPRDVDLGGYGSFDLPTSSNRRSAAIGVFVVASLHVLRQDRDFDAMRGINYGNAAELHNAFLFSFVSALICFLASGDRPKPDLRWRLATLAISCCGLFRPRPRSRFGGNCIPLIRPQVQFRFSSANRIRLIINFQRKRMPSFQPLQHGQVFAAGFPEPLQHEPSRLLRDADFLRQLKAGYAFAGRHKQVHRVNPLVQRNVAALEYRAGANGKVLLTLVAAVEAALAGRDPLAKPANRTGWAVRPKPGFEIGPRRFRVGDQGEQFKGRYGTFAHGPKVVNSPALSIGSYVYNSLRLWVTRVPRLLKRRTRSALRRTRTILILRRRGLKQSMNI